jgi:hypothetical protein
MANFTALHGFVTTSTITLPINFSRNSGLVTSKLNMVFSLFPILHFSFNILSGEMVAIQMIFLGIYI